MTKDAPQLTRDIAPFGLRMTPVLKARVQAAAERNNRSMNAEIVATLEEHYPASTGDFGEMFLQVMDELADLSEKPGLTENEYGAAVNRANIRMFKAGHSHIVLTYAWNDGRPSWSARNSRTLSKLVDATGPEREAKSKAS